MFGLTGCGGRPPVFLEHDIDNCSFDTAMGTCFFFDASGPGTLETHSILFRHVLDLNYIAWRVRLFLNKACLLGKEVAAAQLSFQTTFRHDMVLLHLRLHSKNMFSQTAEKFHGIIALIVMRFYGAINFDWVNTTYSICLFSFFFVRLAVMLGIYFWNTESNRTHPKT